MVLTSLTISDETSNGETSISFTHVANTNEDQGEIVQRLANAAHGYLFDEIVGEVEVEEESE